MGICSKVLSPQAWDATQAVAVAGGDCACPPFTTPCLSLCDKCSDLPGKKRHCYFPGHQRTHSLSGSPSSKVEFYHKRFLPGHPLLWQGPLRGMAWGIPHALGAYQACTALGGMFASCNPSCPLFLQAQPWASRVLALTTALTS